MNDTDSYSTTEGICSVEGCNLPGIAPVSAPAERKWAKLGETITIRTKTVWFCAIHCPIPDEFRDAWK